MSVKIRELTKNFGNQWAVNGISFEARPGEILGFLGPNGAGKSTTMKIATAYLPPTSGTVEICGYDVVNNPLNVRKHVGYLPESNPLYYDMYVHEFLQFIGRLHGLKGKYLKDRIHEMIALCGLEQEQKKKIEQLSKGYKQRVGLAQTLIHDPKVLILDEPTGGLDPNQITEIRQLIQNISQEKTVIFSTHIMQEVQAICQRVVIIHQGNIVANNTLDELQKKDQKPSIEVEFSEEVNTSLLAEIQGVEEVKVEAHGKYKLLTHDQSEDVRPAVFKFATDNNLSLLGMQQLHQDHNKQGDSLETIFRNLTK